MREACDDNVPIMFQFSKGTDLSRLRANRCRAVRCRATDSSESSERAPGAQQRGRDQNALQLRRNVSCCGIGMGDFHNLNVVRMAGTHCKSRDTTDV